MGLYPPESTTSSTGEAIDLHIPFGVREDHAKVLEENSIGETQGLPFGFTGIPVMIENSLVGDDDDLFCKTVFSSIVTKVGDANEYTEL